MQNAQFQEYTGVTEEDLLRQAIRNSMVDAEGGASEPMLRDS